MVTLKTLLMYHGTLQMYHGTLAVYHGTFSYGKYDSYNLKICVSIVYSSDLEKQYFFRNVLLFCVYSFSIYQLYFQYNYFVIMWYKYN